LIQQLQQTKTKTLSFFDLDAEDLKKTYASGSWTVQYILHHLTDTETVLFDRIRRIISKPRPVIWGFDQEAWANKLSYEQRPLALSKKLYESTREGIIYYAGLHYEKDGHLEFIHSETGVRTLKNEFDKVAEHNQNHINQIIQALK